MRADDGEWLNLLLRSVPDTRKGPSMTDVITGHIEIVQGAAGSNARIAGRRIRVMDVAIWSERLGMSPDEIVDNHPSLTLADVHAALAYYWDHRAEIEREIEEDRAAIQAYRRRLGPGPLAEKLRRRRD